MNDLNNIHIGQKLKFILKIRGISAREFAKKLDISFQSVYNIFNRKTISKNLLDKILNVLDININELLEESNNSQLNEPMALYKLSNNDYLKNELDQCRKTCELLTELVKAKDRIIIELEEKLKQKGGL